MMMMMMMMIDLVARLGSSMRVGPSTENTYKRRKISFMSFEQ
jgi:hypothetical protein